MRVKKTVSFLVLLLGLSLVAQVVFPIASYQFWQVAEESKFLISPYPNGSEILGVTIKNQDNFPAFVSDRKRVKPAPFQQFELTIPKIGVKDAKVNVDSNDLDKGPALLPGTALPGERGNVFISSHSSVLFNNNFSRLNNLKVGDPIKLNAAGTEFSYQVVAIKIVDPGDVSIIEPPDNLDRYLSLMTCVPPGLNIKRLVVLAKLI